MCPWPPSKPPAPRSARSIRLRHCASAADARSPRSSAGRLSADERARIMAELPRRLAMRARGDARRAGLKDGSRSAPPALAPARRPRDRAARRSAGAAGSGRSPTQRWDFSSLVIKILSSCSSAAVLMLFRERFSQALEAALFWVAIALVLALGYTYRSSCASVGDGCWPNCFPAGPRRAGRWSRSRAARGGDF